MTDGRNPPQRWTIANPDNTQLYPWVLYDSGAPVRSFGSFGSAYTAMVKLLEAESNAE